MNGRKTILLVDDDAGTLRVLSSGLSNTLGMFDVATATNGREAIEVLDARPVDVVVTDLAMPVMDGFALIGHLTNRDATVPVVVLSALAPHDIDVGLNGYHGLTVLTKPAGHEEVASAVLQALEQVERGQVEGIPLPSVLQLVEAERRTCTLVVSSGRRRGRLHFESGRLINAFSDDFGAEGEAAAHDVLSWERTAIVFDRLPDGIRRIIHLPTQAFLVEVARRQDERAVANASWAAPHGTDAAATASDGVPAGAPGEAPADAPADAPGDMAPVGIWVSAGTSAAPRADAASAEAPDEAPHDEVPHEMTLEAPGAPPQASDAGFETPSDAPDQASNQASDEAADHAADQESARTVDEPRYQVPDEATARVADDAADDAPDRAADQAPDEAPDAASAKAPDPAPGGTGGAATPAAPQSVNDLIAAIARLTDRVQAADEALAAVATEIAAFHEAQQRYDAAVTELEAQRAERRRRTAAVRDDVAALAREILAKMDGLFDALTEGDALDHPPPASRAERPSTGP